MRALRELGAVRVTVRLGEVELFAELPEPESAPQRGGRVAALRPSERKRLEQLEAREARMAEIPGYLEEGA